MTTEVSICNLALGWLGQDAITSFEDQSQKAELCKINYPSARDSVIESRSWRFATVRKVSVTTLRPGDQDDDEFPAWGSGFVHRVPAGMLAVFRAYSDVTGSEENWIQANWQREGDYVLSEESTLYLWGVRRVESPTKFSELFVQSLAQRLAADLCIPLTENRTLQADMWSLYNDKLDEAAVRDGQQGRAERTTANRLKNARRR